MAQYPIPDTLLTNPAIHCATLAVTQDVVTGQDWPQLAQPDQALRNGTLTFVMSQGRTFGITCQHVVQHYRDVVAASGIQTSHSMRTMVNGFYVVLDRFIQPQTQFGDPPPDIAIREINPDHIKQIGKVPLDLDTLLDVPAEIRHAFAVGFPEKLKYNKHDGGPGYRVSMPQVHILAELPARPTRRFTMFSELETPALDIDYSGMSGGPIFWTTQDAYGILGIVYEGGPGDRNKTIYIYGEIATPDVIRSWIDQYPKAP